MSEPKGPTLKLKFGKKPAPPPAEPVPVEAAPAAPPKLTLKIGRKPQPPPEPSEEKPKKKKASSKKRPAENAAPPEPAVAQPGPKRLKLNASKLKSIRIKNKGHVPNRPVGVGYDSEASDTEMDPSIEEQFILRMLPGEDCDYLRQAIEERKFDKSEFSFKPLNREGRRAIFKVRNKQYAACLVDLPCIIEGMKSWDRRGWYKSADICQMLLVLGTVTSDQEALDYPIPPELESADAKTLQYPHGLAPPLRYVRKRRFRDRVSSRTIEQVEKAVEDLVAQDEQSLFPPRFDLVDSAALNRAEGFVQEDYDEDYDEEQDAEGEVDEMMDDFEDDLAAEMEAALAAGDDDAAAAVTEAVQAATASTPAAPTEGGGDSSGEEEVSDEDDDIPEDDLDEEQLEQQRQLQQHREEIAELEALIQTETAQWQKVQNQILRNKMGRRIQELKKDLELKKVSIGMPGENDE
jgi:transcription initiation factor TFIID subunit 7